MAYELHIKRSDENPIALSEWHAAIKATEGTRIITTATHAITNPKTGEVIKVGAREGDAEVYFAESDKWQAVFRWRGKSAAFAARFDAAGPSHPVWKAAVALATRLGATIRGDSGEVYDFHTVKVIGGSKS